MGISTRHPPRGSKSGRRPIPAQPDEYSRTAEIIKQNLQIVENNPESPEAMEALKALQAVSPEDMERYLKENNIGFPEQTAVKRSKSFRR